VPASLALVVTNWIGNRIKATRGSWVAASASDKFGKAATASPITSIHIASLRVASVRPAGDGLDRLRRECPTIGGNSTSRLMAGRLDRLEAMR